QRVAIRAVRRDSQCPRDAYAAWRRPPSRVRAFREPRPALPRESAQPRAAARARRLPWQVAGPTTPTGRARRSCCPRLLQQPLAASVARPRTSVWLLAPPARQTQPLRRPIPALEPRSESVQPHNGRLPEFDLLRDAT